MGERETTPQELEAMREPVMRERRQRQEQEDYLGRVRAKAEERAREILGAAYAERQKILAEAHQQIETQARQADEDAAGLKEQARSVLAEAEAERTKAQALREDAAQLREAMRQEGYRHGMEQAGEELREFRADVAGMLAGVLHGLEEQRAVICDAWRETLVELTHVAVEAGTAWILQAEHQQILRRLVLDSLHLLEDRATVTVRVHPDDEKVVGDMFKDARESVPELRQWIVEGDATLEPGDIVAESGSGSVENLRANYREMVDNILEHLTLPQSPAESQAEARLKDAVASHTARLSEFAHEAEAAHEMTTEETASAAPSLQEDTPTTQPDDGMRNAGARGQDVPGASRTQMPQAMPGDAAGADTLNMAAAQPMPSVLPADMPPDVDGGEHEPEVHPAAEDALFDGLSASAAQEGAVPAEMSVAVSMPVADNPSLAELEDELFPLPADESPGADKEQNVFSDGGFLPGAEPQG